MPGLLHQALARTPTSSALDPRLLRHLLNLPQMPCNSLPSQMLSTLPIVATGIRHTPVTYSTHAYQVPEIYQSAVLICTSSTLPCCARLLLTLPPSRSPYFPLYQSGLLVCTLQGGNWTRYMRRTSTCDLDRSGRPACCIVALIMMM